MSHRGGGYGSGYSRKRGGGPTRGGGRGRGRGRGGPPPGLKGRDIGMFYAQKSQERKKEQEKNEVKCWLSVDFMVFSQFTVEEWFALTRDNPPMSLSHIPSCSNYRTSLSYDTLFLQYPLYIIIPDYLCLIRLLQYDFFPRFVCSGQW